MTKICTNVNCQKEKDISEFRKNKNLPDGHENQCKDCRKEKQKSSYKEQDWNKRKRERRQLNPELNREYQAKWREDNREKYREYNRKWRTKSISENLYHNCKKRAALKGIEFNIDKEDIIIPQYCPLLNVELKTDFQKGYNLEDKKYFPSLDRKDNTKGYVKGNVWVISVLANMMKNIASKEQLKTFSENILKQIEHGLFK